MSGKKVYLESSVISYLTVRPSRDVIKIAKQELMRQWWKSYKAKYDLHVSSFVMAEISHGDVQAVRQRLDVVEGLPEITLTDAAVELYEMLLAAKAVPASAMVDAMHIALAVANGMDYLLTWNCTHINNAAHKKKIATVVSHLGYTETVLTTPEELTR
jgi:hypothetical protein